MKWLRFEHDGRIRYGYQEGDLVHPVAGTCLQPGDTGGEPLPLGQVRLLAPCEPSKVVCVGINYDGHIREVGRERPPEPVIFLKPPTAVVGPGAEVVRPLQTESLYFEGELAVVMGRKARRITPEAAPAHILGYTCANDVSARDLQKRDGQWTRGKGFDTFCPLGPWIVTDLDPSALSVQTRLSGQLCQDGNTRDLIYGVYELISFISQVMTLEPGDVVLTGTPAGAGPMQPGQEVAVTIQGIGTLTNPIVQEV